MTAPPAWWTRLPRPAAQVINTAEPATVYQLAAVRREHRRLERQLLPRVSGEAALRVAAAVAELQAADAVLLAELESRG